MRGWVSTRLPLSDWRMSKKPGLDRVNKICPLSPHPPKKKKYVENFKPFIWPSLPVVGKNLRSPKA